MRRSITRPPLPDRPAPAASSLLPGFRARVQQTATSQAYQAAANGSSSQPGSAMPEHDQVTQNRSCRAEDRRGRSVVETRARRVSTAAPVRRAARHERCGASSRHCALKPLLLAAPLAALLLSGCLARTAIDVVTLPVRAASAGVDAVTTSQAEADRNRGREIRRREERLGRLDRRYRQVSQRCSAGDESACAEARTLWGQISALAPAVPYEARR